MRNCVDCAAAFSRGNKAVRCLPCAEKRKAEGNKRRSQAWIAANPERNREHKRLWAKLHPEQVNAAARRRYPARAEILKERTRNWQRLNREKKKAAKRAWEAANYEHRRVSANRRARAAYRRDPDQFRIRSQRWEETNPERATASRRTAYHTRRARERGNTTEPITAAEWQQRFALFGGFCAYCDQPATQIDHVIPVARGGGNDLYNVVPACAACNYSKGSKLPLDWVPEP